MLWTLPLIPILIGLILWAIDQATEPPRIVPGTVGCASMAVSIALAGWALGATPTATFDWGGALFLQLKVTPVVGVMALIVPSVALPVILWASTHENKERLGRLVGLLLVFVGSMELLILAADLLTLTIGWELVGALSWALIGHERDDPAAQKDAAYAYNATRLGGLGLFLAAGAAVAQTGSFAFDALGALAASPWGHLFAAGILLAAASKSAQIPFSPWLFRAMAGPTSVSALLHSSTMVAAGAWVLIRLHEPLLGVSWFGGVAIGVGLSTAVLGGLVASAQPQAKKLLAASTSAHYGFIFAAVGAGAAGAALAHLGTHAAFKALLFLVAGTAIAAAHSHKLRDMRLGRLLPWTAAAGAIGALALAGIPPLGGAWSKEKILAGLGHTHTLLLWVGIAAAFLSAWYAARFYFLAYGRENPRDLDAEKPCLPHTPERVGMALLALATLGLSALWIPSVSEAVGGWLGMEWPHGATWEAITASAAAVCGVVGAWFVYRPGNSTHTEQSRALQIGADWFMLPTLLDRVAVRPTLALADGCARFDERIVDTGVRGAAKCADIASHIMDRFPEASLQSATRGAAGLTRAVATVCDRAVEASLHSAAQGAAGFTRAVATVCDRAIEASVDLMARGLAAFTVRSADASRVTDDRLIDRGAAAGAHAIGDAARPVQRAQTGEIPRYYIYATGGLFLLILIALIWR